MARTGAVSVWRASAAEVAWHYAVRQRVFVEEQGALVLTDLDARDRQPDVQHVIAACGEAVVGVVRLYPLDDGGRWKGDRLAVLRTHRATSVGARLVRFAVSTAAEAGGSVMHAHIQLPNVAFFERLGWVRDGVVQPYLGMDHQPMVIDLLTAARYDGGVRPACPCFDDHPAEAPSCLLDPSGDPMLGSPPGELRSAG